MLIDQAALSDISQAISEAIAPGFLLAAISGFLSLMAVRLTRIQDRIRSSPNLDNDDSRVDTSSLKARAAAINMCMFLLMCSAMCVVLFIILVFATTMLSLHYERVILNIFFFALILLLFALTLAAREIWSLRKDAY